MTAAEATELGLASEPLVIGFGNDRQGDDLLAALFDRASQRGAAHVSSITVHIVVGTPTGIVDCSTHIGPDAEIAERVAAMPPLERHELRGRFRRVDWTLTRERRVCAPVQRRRATGEPITERECRRVVSTEPVAGYAFQAAIRYVPPDERTLRRLPSRWNIVESRPHCVPTSTTTARHRIEAMIHRADRRQ